MTASQPLPPADESASLGPPAEHRSDSPEDREARRWLREVYQGDRVRQLSVRSVVTGMAIGAVMSISNLYVGLKTGWGLGVTITSCIIAFAVFKALEAVVPAYRRNPFTILENYTMSSAASAAAYMSSAGLVSAIPALYLSTGRVLNWWEMMLWLGSVSVLGVFMAIPLKRQLINIDQLPFPSGIATAETLKSIHAHGKEAMRKARALLWTAVIGAIVTLWREGLPIVAGWLRDRPKLLLDKFILPAELPFFPGAWGRGLVGDYTLGFEGSLLMVAAGAIMGIRVGVSLLLGGIFFYGILAPQLHAHGIIQNLGYKGIVAWTLWPATALMVTSSLLGFCVRWRTMVRAFGELGKLVGRPRRTSDPLAGIEAPTSWFVLGTAVSGGACVLFAIWRFDVSWWEGILAVLLTFVLSIVAARATGETDVTPIGAMGKITQLFFAGITPAAVPGRFMTTNLMTASITAGASSHSADLLTDLKSGYLLGGNPRKQTLSQLYGVLAGTLLCVPVYTIIVRTPPRPAAVVVPAAALPQQPVAAMHGAAKPAAAETNLGSKDLPAPSAVVWAAVAKMLANPKKALPDGAVIGMLIGGILGILITLAEELLPHRYHKWIPSATGLGIAGVIPAFNSISMFLGAFVAWLWMKKQPHLAEQYVIPGSSGLIAGESLMGVAIILCQEGPKMVNEIWHSLTR